MTIARHGISMSLTSVKQWKTSFPSTTLFLFLLLLLAHETPAMPKTPRQDATFKPIRNNIPRISVENDNGTVEPAGGNRFKYYIYEAGLLLEAPKIVTWYYHFSSKPMVKRQSIPLKPLEGMNSQTIFLENFIEPGQKPDFPGQPPSQKKLPERIGYHYFSFRNNSNKRQATIVEIRVTTQLDLHIIPDNPPPLPEAPLTSPQSPPSSTLEYPSYSFENPPTPPESIIEGYLRHYDIILDPIEGAGTEASYWLLNYDPESMLVHPAPPEGISPEGMFLNPLRTRFFFYTPGIKKISISYGGHTKLETITVPPGKRLPTVVLLNANDNNGNQLPDHKDGLFPNEPLIPDPELTPINLLGDSWMYYFPPWELGNDGFFSQYQGCRFRLSATPGIRLWNNQTRHFTPVLKWTINPEERDMIRQWLQTAIYIEGLQPSTHDGQEIIKLELLTPAGELISDLTWPVTVLHLYVNHDSLGTNFENLTFHSPFNTIINPAVITSNTHFDSWEEKCAWFEAESSNPALLKKYEHLIQWRTYAQDPANRPLLLDAIQVNNDFFFTGRKAAVLGLAPTIATIGLRLTGATNDYISFKKMVVQPRRIPCVLHFFSEQKHPEQDYRNRIALLKTNIKKFLPLMNAIGRQAGIIFEIEEAVSQDSIACYTNELFWEVIQTTSNGVTPKEFHLKEPFHITPPIPNDGLNMIFNGHDGQKFLYQGVIHKVKENKATTNPNIPPLILLHPIESEKKFTLRPFLPQSKEEYQTEITQGVFLHKGIPMWTLSKYNNTAYTTAIASMANTVNINFAKLPFSTEQTLLSAATAPLNTPTNNIFLEENSVNITTHFQYNLIPKLGDKNIAATLYSMATWENQFKSKKPASRALTLVQSILETLGLQPHGLTGDLSFYQDQAARNQALNQNILVERKKILFINPISPCTDHTALPENYPLRNLIQDKETANNPRSMRYKINAAQATLLHLHPLTRPN